jgi:hypothetical protein
MRGKKYTIGKGLEAVGIATVIIAIIQGIMANDMWGELYFWLGGMAIFYVGRQLEKKG